MRTGESLFALRDTTLYVVMVLKLWKSVSVCICEMRSVEFGLSCRVENVVCNVSDSARFIVSTL